MLVFQSIKFNSLVLVLLLHLVSINAQCQTRSLNTSFAHAPLQVNLQILHPSCAGQLGLLTILAQGGVPPYTYFANGNAVTPSSNLFAGTYTISVFDAANNIVQTQATIINPTPLNVQYCLLPSPCAACLTPVNIIPSGGTPPYSYFVNTQQGTPPFLLASGTHTILVEDANACSFTTNLKVAKSNNTTSPIGIKKYLITMEDIAYPNPFQHKLNLQINNSEIPIEFIQITNMSGQVMYVSQQNAIGIQSIDTYAWPPGAYRLMLRNQQQQEFAKTIIKN